MLQRKKKWQTGAAGGLRGVQTDGGYMGKVGGLCSLCPRTQTELRIDCFVLVTFKGVEKHLNCHEGSTSSAFTLPLLWRIKTCAALLALFICKLARLGIRVTNCPGLENSQSFLQQVSCLP